MRICVGGGRGMGDGREGAEHLSFQELQISSIFSHLNSYL